MNSIASVRAAVARAQQRIHAQLPGDETRAQAILKQQTTYLRRLEERS